MSGIQPTFERLQAARRKALIPFITAGDPDAALTVPLMHSLVEAGADIIELGVPFSDPMADGPTIQRASERALARGMTLRTTRHLLVPAYLAGTIFAITLFLPFLGTEIFPQIDAGQLQLRLRAPTATRLETTEQIAQRALAIIGEEAPIATSMGLIGVHAPNYPVNLIHQWNSGPEEATLQIQLKPGSPPIAALREKLRARLAAEFPYVLFSFEPADIVSRVMALGSPTPIEVAVSGKDFAASRAHAETLRTKLTALKGTCATFNSAKPSTTPASM